MEVVWSSGGKEGSKKEVVEGRKEYGGGKKEKCSGGKEGEVLKERKEEELSI